LARHHALKRDTDNQDPREESVQQREVEITNKEGLNATASAKLAQIASKYLSDISVTRAGRKINAKSLLGVMMLAAGPGSHVVIEADGPDESEALAAVVAVIAGAPGTNP
jgi:phosphocarrier protein HPr